MPRTCFGERGLWTCLGGCNFATGDDHQNLTAESQANGLMAGSTTLLPLENTFRKNVVLAMSGEANRAHLRSHSGCNAGAALLGAPTGPEVTVEPTLFRTLLRERLRLPLDVTEAHCEGCGERLDEQGRHRAACPKTGRLKKRAVPPECAVARMCREAGATVRRNAKLKDLNLGVSQSDGRHVKVLAQGLPCYGGRPMVVDVTLRHGLTAEGLPHPGAATRDGAVAERARQDKEDTYPELVGSSRCKLVVVAVEMGGRWSAEAADFVERLAYAKARETTPLLRAAARLAWERRWVRMLSTACAKAFALSLVAPVGTSLLAAEDGGSPELSDLLGRACGDERAGAASEAAEPPLNG